VNPSGAAGACKALVDRGEVTLFIATQILVEVAEVLGCPRIRQLAPALTLEHIEAFLADIAASV
jgi:hypothetical protein